MHRHYIAERCVLEILWIVLAALVLVAGAYRHVLSDRRLFPYDWSDGSAPRPRKAEAAFGDAWDEEEEAAQGQSR